MAPLNQGLDSPYLAGATGQEQSYLPTAAWARGAGRHYLNPSLHGWTHHRPSLHTPAPHHLSLGPKVPTSQLEPRWGLDRRVKAPAHLSARRRSSHGTARSQG